MNKNVILYLVILIFGITAPFIFPAFKVQLSILCVLIVLALTWNIQGGEMGYNTFGNILFYGLGMFFGHQECGLGALPEMSVCHL